MADARKIKEIKAPFHTAAELIDWLAPEEKSDPSIECYKSTDSSSSKELHNFPMPRSRYAYVFLGSFLVTIFLLQWWQEPRYPFSLWLILGFVGLVGFLGFFLTDKSPTLLIPLALGITLAFLSVARTAHVATPTAIDYYAAHKEVTLTGIVIDEPEQKPPKMIYTLAVSSIIQNGTPIAVTGKTLVTHTKGWPVYEYGDTVKATGILDVPDHFSTYSQYLSVFGIRTTLDKAIITKKESSNHWSLYRFLFRIKRSFEGRINQLYGEPDASLLAGILLGSRSSIPDGILETFKIVGLTHILAISGFNITIILTTLSSLLFWLPIKKRFIPSVIAVILFTLLVGASASVVRACIMGVLGLLALQSERIQTPRLTVLWTLFLMLLWNPLSLWYDAGFQLSFLALIGILEGPALFERLSQYLPDTLGIRESLQLTLAAQFFASPWIVFLFGNLSLISPIANLLVAPLIPLSMLLGFLSILISILSPALGQLIAFVTSLCLQAIVWIPEMLAQVPYASIELQSGSATVIGAYYVGLVGVLWWVGKRVGVGVHQ